nr:hypothetical protein BaRGS_010229 [Batillaria attramentaria]
MPYSHGPSVKKLSKMSTLLLARNYIVMLTRTMDEMRRLLQELTASRAGIVCRQWVCRHRLQFPWCQLPPPNRCRLRTFLCFPACRSWAAHA